MTVLTVWVVVEHVGRVEGAAERATTQVQGMRACTVMGVGEWV